MRFVDEFRDADKAHALAAKIAALCEPGRQYKFMEVCGGHTHTIYKHGLEDYLPEAINLVHGPGCPVCVIPMGRVDDAMALASDPNVIMTSFGDMMRVPGSQGSFFDAMVQLSSGRSEVENQYSRVVPWDGNVVALKAIAQTMELRPYFEWRGLGFISHSALRVRSGRRHRTGEPT